MEPNNQNNTPLSAAQMVDQDSGSPNTDILKTNSTNTTLTSATPRPDFSLSQSEVSNMVGQNHYTTATLTSSTANPGSSSSSTAASSNSKPPSHISSLSTARSSKLALDSLVYEAIIQNDIPTLSKILSDNPNYYLNLPIRIREVNRLSSGQDDITGDIRGDDKTPLMIAASLDYVDAVKCLLKNPNVNIDLRDEQGETALFQAASAGNAEVVKVLLKNYAIVDLSDNHGLSPLSIAACNGHTYVCRMLLDRGKANINQKDETGKTALAHAAHKGHSQTVETLLSRGADFNITDKFGWTPLMLAAYAGQANIVRRLLLNGADRSLKTASGKTAVTLARDNGFVHVADMIENFATKTYKSRTVVMKENDDYEMDGRVSNVEKGSGLNELYNPETKRLSYRVNASRSYTMDWSQRRQHIMSEDSRRVSTSSRLRLEMAPRKKNTLWVYISWIVTAPFLDRFLISIGGMDDARSRQAWREKVTLCFFIGLASLFVALITFGFVALSCNELPPIPNLALRENSSSVINSQVMIVRGKIYNVGDFFKLGFHRPLLSNNNDSTLSPIINSFLGKDVSQFFPVNNPAIGCRFAPSNETNSVLCPSLPLNDSRYHCHSSKNSVRALESLSTDRFIGISWDEISNRTSDRKLLVFNNFVYDFASYLDPSNTDLWLGDDGAVTKLWIQSLIGFDATKEISTTRRFNDVAKCFDHFRVGKVEGIVYGCAAMTTVVVVLTTVTTLFGIMKLLSALIFGYFIGRKIVIADKKPFEELQRIIVLVPCYSEGKEGLKMSLDSLAATDYSDQHKLLFVVADGDITGSGETRSTPEILKDLIVPYDEVDRFSSIDNTQQNSGTKWKESTPKSYIAIGPGTKRHNMAQVYTGYYLYENRRVPTILVIKCGTPSEQKSSPKPGNRGKRDSQLVLMNLLNKAYYNEPMTDLEFELFEKIRLISGVTVDQYELMCMVDADTVVEEHSLSRMIACMDRDPSVIGICGETKILNKTDNWVTMIQVFEYYISHNLGKTFESLFAGVTCLPGCFCMYRVYAYNREGFRTPILLDSDVMKNYSTNDVDTFHQKNLLLLGEDRYLTTLILRAFPKRKTIYCPSAICLTAVPDSFSVLVSQRRRWINGTVHNLLELIVASELPGRFCCSMQFVAFLDFFGTVTAPFATFYLFALVIAVIFGQPYGLQVLYSAITYFVQFALVIITGYKPMNIVWFLIYAFSTPIWFAMLPLYAFWNFDDFTWGTTRKIEGTDNGHDEDTIFDRFDPRKVELKKWDEWIIYRQLHRLPMLAPLPQLIKPNVENDLAPKNEELGLKNEIIGDNNGDIDNEIQSQPLATEEKILNTQEIAESNNS
ncbi:4127_t:CDS:2 [Acaulospora morrowiae]|uniref:chitin synthase n=1 Tax=Acaulospora morrowiae TaxID=94023 RepID=A0A9N8WJ89_9GLOM|nr:4127_t:CDS:2 [Acaulospora morrowiae]